LSASSTHPPSDSADGLPQEPASVFSFADALPDIVCFFEGSGGLRGANAAWFAFTGITAENALGQGWEAALAATDREAFTTQFRARTRYREVFELEFPLLRRDGAERWMRWRFAPLDDLASGAPLWVGTSVDVDDGKRARSERDVFRALVDTGSLGIAFVDRSGAIVSANEKFLQMTGYDQADVAAGRLRWRDMTPSAWGAADERAIEEFARCGFIKPYEKEYIRKDGTRVPILIGVAGQTDGVSVCYASDLSELKRTEAAQRVSDSRLRRLFDANIIGIVIGDNAGAILEANDAFLDMLGFTRDELEAGLVDWRERTPAEWLPLDERAIVEMASSGVFSLYEKEYERRDGTRVSVSLGGARIAGTDDQQICYITDLTSTREMQAALRRSESRFTRLADANVVGIMSTRLGDDTIVEANDEFLRTVGFERRDLEAGLLRWNEMTPPEFRDASGEARATLRATGRFSPVEKEYVRKDGSRVPVLVGGALLEGFDEVVCWVLDLTERSESIRRLEESEYRYRLLAEALPEIVMLTDENRQPVYVNRYYEAYTGIGLAAAPERWLDVIHPGDFPAVARARATGESYEIEYRLRRFDGVYRWHFARVLKLIDGPYGARWLAAAMDIDDRKRAEESLRFIEKAGAKLARSLDLETTFETLLDLVVPQFGDWAAINLCDERGVLKTVVARHADPEKDEVARQLIGLSYARESLTWGTSGAFKTGKPQLVARVGRSEIEEAIKDEYLPIFERLGYGSSVALPIVAGDEVVGSFGIISAGHERVYCAADLPPLEELARRAGFAIANAREYEREHRVASLMQEAALPRTLPKVAGLTFDGYYRAGRKEALIGGDWFDVLVLADGRVVVSVGDVAGSGLVAAVLMSNVRQLIRGAANVYTDPMLVLDVADRTLRCEAEDRMVTAFVGIIDPAARSMRYASAGHLPALLRTSGDTILELTTPGLPLGYRAYGASASGTIVLPEGSCLLLYTDGLVEWSRDVIAGERLLKRRFIEAARSAGVEHPARALVNSILSTGGGRDDVAALTVTIAERAAPPPTGA